jgi:nucleoside-diphosphate-sugar epimerase
MYLHPSSCQSSLIIAEKTGNYQTGVIDPAIRSVVNILQAAQKARCVRRIVITSSIAAIVPWDDFTTKETRNIWIPTDINVKSLEPYENGFRKYCAVKTICLHATNDFMRDLDDATFDVINIIPSFIIGRNELVDDPKSLLDGSNGLPLGPILGHKKGSSTPSLSVFLDDVAEIHIAALDPSIEGNQNFVASSGGLSGTVWDDGVEIARRRFQDAVQSGLLPLGGSAPRHLVMVDASKTETVFGMKFRAFEDQVVSLVSQYVDLSGRGCSK